MRKLLTLATAIAIAPVGAGIGLAADLGIVAAPPPDAVAAPPASVMFAPVQRFPWQPVQTHIVAQPVTTEVVYPDYSPADQAPVIIMVVPPRR